ncbi:hypothetical protein [Deinococcus hopiensis]|uniref:Uncharacterized protein n=1 Tax=Deinococcus hopiensis KR-140 TaxID=695939 RepID=A0A1W1VP05_9DEIO|nr:hypothetical protein [Deinococcus hopiensis]SMB95056.1 hypothetical protein SAMN00790413_02671 [Deinococcus hopiensis KR-140]
MNKKVKKRLLLGLALLPLLQGPALAASIPSLVLTYVDGSNKIKPTAEKEGAGTIDKFWEPPKNVLAQMLALFYCYALGSDCWSVLVRSPKFSRPDVVGTKNLT